MRHVMSFTHSPLSMRQIGVCVQDALASPQLSGENTDYRGSRWSWIPLSFLFHHLVLEARCAQVVLASSLATVSVPITATWLISNGESSTFVMALVIDNDLVGELTETTTTVHAPTGSSSGPVTLRPTATGSHRLAIVSPFVESSPSFDVVDAEAAGSESPGGSSSSRVQSVQSTTASTSSAGSSPTISIDTPTAKNTTSNLPTTSTPTPTPTPTPTTANNPSSANSTSNATQINIIAIILGAIFGTMLFIIILVASTLFILRRRRRRHLRPTSQAYTYNSQKSEWEPRGGRANDETSSALSFPKSLWIPPSMFSTLGPSDSVSQTMPNNQVVSGSESPRNDAKENGER
ncbi:hypothetical protein D9757_013440 [Collybiopsis confluens]|uniref:Uncharacterized protein n=1 Tax=Collybiopsis confluens TaxID=2823264 RepID=A0A8H5CPK5_9AGAR|nr:hypothetical protein D9757_013440 [Collybiopsis confluens]